MLWTLRNKRYTNKLLLVLLCENSFRLTLENVGSYSLVFAVLTSEARVRYARGGGGGEWEWIPLAFPSSPSPRCCSSLPRPFRDRL